MPHNHIKIDSVKARKKRSIPPGMKEVKSKLIKLIEIETSEKKEKEGGRPMFRTENKKNKK